MLTSSASAGASGGRIPGSRAASMDLPEPGGPIISMLWPPAAATSSARLADSWPLMSRRSGSAPTASASFGCGGVSTWLPLMWLISASSVGGASTSICPAQAASPPCAAGQISPRFWLAAWIAAGSTPATGAIEPSRPSSPSAV